jgi:cytochrome c oxidase accessory protein FixG
MQESPLEHKLAFGVVAFLTIVLWFCFAWFREQFCVIMCPYGRIQSALSDDDTVVIGYDEVRGEPRGHVQDPDAGDCIDCRRCVQVCPTGIDIRNGLQLECIGCTACIDACDEIMDKVGRPRGLVRYDSMNALAGRARRFLRPRIFAYCALGLVGLAVLGVIASKRAKPYTTTLSRMEGASFFSDDSMVRNIYQLRLLNKRNQDATFSVELGPETPPGFTLGNAGQEFRIGPLGEQTRPCVIFVTRDSYTGPTDLKLVVTGNPGDVKIEQKIRFLGPDPKLLSP